MITRRGFFGFLGAAAAAAVVAPKIELLEDLALWVPSTTLISLPAIVHRGNTLRTAHWISREALRILHDQCKFFNVKINREYSDAFSTVGSSHILHQTLFPQGSLARSA